MSDLLSRINPAAFVASLPIMLKGMIGIFIVTAIILLVIGLLNAFTSKKKKS